MKIKLSEFAKMCNISRQAVSKLVAKSVLKRGDDGFIDTEEPINKIYFAKKMQNAKNDANFVKSDVAHEKSVQTKQKPILSATEPKKKAEKSPQNPTEHLEKLSLNDELAKLKSDFLKKQQEENAVQTVSDFFMDSEGNSIDENTAKHMLDMKLFDLLVVFGNFQNMERVAKIQRDFSTSALNQQKLEEKRLDLVPKNFVLSAVFSSLNMLYNRLLDLTQKLSGNIVAKVQSGVEIDNDKIVFDENLENGIVEIMSSEISKILTDSQNMIEKSFKNLKGKFETGEEVREKMIAALQSV